MPLHIARDLASGTLDPFTLGESCMIIPVATDPKCFPTGPEVWELHPDWVSLMVFCDEKGGGEGEHARVSFVGLSSLILFIPFGVLLLVRN